MSIQQIASDRLHKIENASQSLRAGQIVQGKIMKLYPNNKAQLTLGSQTMVAQLEASLTVGERYHFQVQSGGEVTHLKVLGDQLEQRTQVNTTELMKHLGVKANKASINLVQNLLKEGISFEKADLMKAIRLLDSTSIKNKPAAEHVLKEMIARNLPITDSVFQALLTKGTSDLSEQMKTLLQQLRQIESPTLSQQNLMNRLSQMIEKPSSSKAILIPQIIDEAVKNNRQLFNILKASGAINPKVEFSTWKSDWQMFSQQQNSVVEKNKVVETSRQLFNVFKANGVIPDRVNFSMWNSELQVSVKQQNIIPLINNTSQQSQELFNQLKASGVISKEVNYSTWKAELALITNQQRGLAANELIQLQSSAKTPQSVEYSTLTRNLSHIQTNSSIQTEAQRLIDTFSNAINKTVISTTALSTQDFTMLKKAINGQLASLLLSEQQQQLASSVQNNPVQLRQLLTMLQTLASNDTNVEVEQLLNSIQRHSMNTIPNKEQFLAQIRQMLQFSGLSHENALLQDNMQQNAATIKSMLIDMVQNNHRGNENAQQLLHFINGLQIQSVNETSNFIQASIQIPGEKLALNNDLFLDFESKKTEDGTINPDYCRILFYLDLTNLKETIIDMQIQKRHVTVTIFNDQENIKKSASLLQPMLKEGLGNLDYHLSTISIKNLQQVEKEKKGFSAEIYQETYEGIDYRI